MEFLNKTLKEIDPLIDEIVDLESNRQKNKLHLNAAISILPRGVSDIQGSVLANIDAEGYIPEYLNSQTLEDLNDIEKQLDYYKRYRDERCNKCCEYANIIESLAQKRLARVFSNDLIKEEDVYVNVQVPTGALANYLVYEAFLKLGDTILSLDQNSGGHTTHGASEHVSYNKYKIINFHIDYNHKDINYDEIKNYLIKEKPQMLIIGPTSFPLEIDFKLIKELINKYSPQTIYVADIAHIAGLIAAGCYQSPFGYADIVTFVGYKTFGGPRAGAIFTFNKEDSDKINETIFPKILGSAVILNVASLAVSANIALTDEYKNFQKRIIENSRALCQALKQIGVAVAYDTSDSHIVVIDIDKYGNLKEMVDFFEDCNIMINGCHVPHLNEVHEAIRLGTTWITELGATESDMMEVAKIVKQVLEFNDINEIKEKVKKILTNLEMRSGG